jgi:hypothetical protein
MLNERKIGGNMFRRLFFVLLSILVLSVICFAQENPAEDQKLIAEEIKICTDIEDREPVGVDTIFADTLEKVYCFTKIVGATDTTSIYHVWYFGDEEKAKVNLPIKSSSWRTWSSKIIAKDWMGKWHVEITTEEGDLLGKKEFEIHKIEEAPEE